MSLVLMKDLAVPSETRFSMFKLRSVFSRTATDTCLTFEMSSVDEKGHESGSVRPSPEQMDREQSDEPAVLAVATLHERHLGWTAGCASPKPKRNLLHKLCQSRDLSGQLRRFCGRMSNENRFHQLSL